MYSFVLSISSCLSNGPQFLFFLLVSCVISRGALGDAPRSTRAPRSTGLGNTVLGHCLTTRHGQDADHDIPQPGCRPTTCLGRDAVLGHGLGETHVYDMPWYGCSFTTCLVGMLFYDIPRLGRSFTTCPGRDAVLQHALVGTHFYDMPLSERSCTKCPVSDAV